MAGTASPDVSIGGISCNSGSMLSASRVHRIFNRVRKAVPEFDDLLIDSATSRVDLPASLAHLSPPVKQKPRGRPFSPLFLGSCSSLSSLSSLPDLSHPSPSPSPTAATNAATTPTSLHPTSGHGDVALTGSGPAADPVATYLNGHLNPAVCNRASSDFLAADEPTGMHDALTCQPAAPPCNLTGGPTLSAPYSAREFQSMVANRSRAPLSRPDCPLVLLPVVSLDSPSTPSATLQPTPSSSPLTTRGSPGCSDHSRMIDSSAARCRSSPSLLRSTAHVSTPPAACAPGWVPAGAPPSGDAIRGHLAVPRRPRSASCRRATRRTSRTVRLAPLDWSLMNSMRGSRRVYAPAPAPAGSAAPAAPAAPAAAITTDGTAAAGAGAALGWPLHVLTIHGAWVPAAGAQRRAGRGETIPHSAATSARGRTDKENLSPRSRALRAMETMIRRPRSRIARVSIREVGMGAGVGVVALQPRRRLFDAYVMAGGSRSRGRVLQPLCGNVLVR